MSGPVNIALEFDVQAAKQEIDEYLREYYSDPMHWANNKRRRTGMKPLRKPINTERRTYPDLFPVWKIVENTLKDVVPKVVEDRVATFAAIEEIES